MIAYKNGSFLSFAIMQVLFDGYWQFDWAHEFHRQWHSFARRQQCAVLRALRRAFPQAAALVSD